MPPAPGKGHLVGCVATGGQASAVRPRRPRGSYGLRSLTAGSTSSDSKTMALVQKVGPKGQVTLPKHVRDALGLKTGDLVETVLGREGAITRPVELRRKKIDLSGDCFPIRRLLLCHSQLAQMRQKTRAVREG